MPDQPRPAQAKAAISQSEMIRASAGSGKTFQLTNRYIGLMAHGVEPERIIALTFTRKAAGEFFDAILEKLARAATDEAFCRELAASPYIPELAPAAFLGLLRKLVSRMHLLTLGTLDSFFSSILRNFPFEFGLGGGFEILDEHLSGLEQRRVYRQVFQRPRPGAPRKDQEAFLQAFKLATFGSEESRLIWQLGRFIRNHHDIYLAAPSPVKWGNRAAIWPGGWQWGEAHGELEKFFTPLISSFERDGLSDKQLDRWTAFRDAAIAHRPGTPMAKPLDYLLPKILEQFPALEAGGGQLTVERRKQDLDAGQAAQLAEIARRLINAELENLLSRTRGIFSVIHEYERTYGRLVRRRGKLTFNDLLIILTSARQDGDAGGIGSGPMLSQVPGSDTRLDIDYRLDGRFDHWLLDEFQDTNFLQWRVIENLIDETVQDTSGQRTLFQVGDVKQAIYGWRGGDVRLFDEIHGRYHEEDGTPRLKTRHLDRSFRSGPDIISMVNRVFGDAGALGEICPDTTLARWSGEWRDHVSNFPERDGYACLLNPDPASGAKVTDQDTFATMLAVLEEIRPDRRAISCAILTQGNACAAEIVEYVRANSDIPIHGESDLHIASDNPLSLAILALFQFAAHPGDSFAWQHLQMTPFGEAMATEGLGAADVADEVLDGVTCHGTASVINRWLGRLQAIGFELDEFSRRRAAEFAAAAQGFDEAGSKNLDEFLSFAENFTLREPVAEGTVQVMTIHKSKGLGFQLVLLPELGGMKLALADDGIGTSHNPDRSVEWVYTLPKKDIALADPALARYIAQQEADNCYEALCKFYVAMTRAKRAMYLIAAPHGKSTSTNFLQLLEATLSSGTTTAADQHQAQVVFASGNPQWFAAEALGQPQPDAAPQRAALPGFPESARRPRHRRRTPSGAAAGGTLTSAQIFAPRGGGALAYGQLVHALFEQIEWLDELAPAAIGERWNQHVPAATAEMRQEVLDSLAAAAPILNRPSPTATCWREQRFEALIDGDWVSGTIDRVILDGGSATVVDFKTVALADGTSPAEAAAPHLEQLHTYRTVVQKMTGLSEKHIRALLYFTKPQLLVEA